MTYRPIALAIALSAMASAQAQLDNVVEVENTYRPTVKDANKMNVLPEVKQTEVKHYNVNYASTLQPTTSYVFQPMEAAQSDAADRKLRSYVTLGGGTNGNVDTRINIFAKPQLQDIINADFSFSGHCGKVDATFAPTDKWESRFYTTRALASYAHYFKNNAALSFKADVLQQVFNYQQNGVLSATDKQHNTGFDFSIGMTPYAIGNFRIGGEVGTRVFSQKYLPMTALYNDKLSETQVWGKATSAYSISQQHGVGLDLSALTTNYDADDFKNYGSYDVTPYYNYTNEHMNLRLGAILHFNSGLKSGFNVAPDVCLRYHASPTLDFVANVQGGEVMNDARHLNAMTPYWSYFSNMMVGAEQLHHQFDVVRAKAGAEWNVAQGLYLNLGIGYDKSKNRAELLNYAQVVTADGSLMHVDADLRYNYQDVLSAGASLRLNGWESDAKGMDETLLLWRPNTEIKADATWRVWRGLRIGADIAIDTYDKNHSVYYRRPNTTNLGASISYATPLSLLSRDTQMSVFLRGNNLLNNNYDQFLGYRAQRANGLVGVAVTF